MSLASTSFSSQQLQFLFLNTLRPAAGSATTTFFVCAAELAAFFVAVAPLTAADVGTFLVVVAVTVVVILPPPLAAAAALFAVTTVVPVLEVLVALEVDMALAVRSCGGTGGGAIVLFFAFAVVVVGTVLGEIFRAAVRVLFFACSTMPARLAVMALVAADVAVFRGLAGFKGEGGRAR